MARLLTDARIVALLLVSLSLVLSGATAVSTKGHPKASFAPSHAPRRPHGPKGSFGAHAPAHAPASPLAKKNKPFPQENEFQEAKVFLEKAVKETEAIMDKVVQDLLHHKFDDATNKHIHVCSQAHGNSNKALSDDAMKAVRARDLHKALSFVEEFYNFIVTCAESMENTRLEEWADSVVEGFSKIIGHAPSSRAPASSPRPSPIVKAVPGPKPKPENKFQKAKVFLEKTAKETDVLLDKVVDDLLKAPNFDAMMNKRIHICSQAHSSSIKALTKDALGALRGRKYHDAVLSVEEFAASIRMCAESMHNGRLRDWSNDVVSNFRRIIAYTPSSEDDSEAPSASPKLAPKAIIIPRKKPSPKPKPVTTDPKKSSPKPAPRKTNPNPKPAPTVPHKPAPSPSNPKKNPKPTPTVPKKVSPSPKHAPTTPKKNSPHPKPTPTVPKKNSPSPKPAPTLPKESSPNPKPTPTVPKIHLPSPKPKPTIPKKNSPSPKPAPTVPKKSSPNPKPTPTVPKKHLPSPKPTPTVPKKNSPSPKKSSPSPKHAPTVPSPKPTTPKKNTPSPKPIPTIPKKNSRSPKPAPAIPKKNSPSPRPVPVVPKKSSPSLKPVHTVPRKAGPSPKPSPTIPKKNTHSPKHEIADAPASVIKDMYKRSQEWNDLIGHGPNF